MQSYGMLKNAKNAGDLVEKRPSGSRVRPGHANRGWISSSPKLLARVDGRWRPGLPEKRKERSGGGGGARRRGVGGARRRGALLWSAKVWRRRPGKRRRSVSVVRRRARLGAARGLPRASGGAETGRGGRPRAPAGLAVGTVDAPMGRRHVAAAGKVGHVRPESDVSGGERWKTTRVSGEEEREFRRGL